MRTIENANNECSARTKQPQHRWQPFGLWVLVAVWLFPCGGATCRNRRPIDDFQPPIVFEQTPSIDSLIERLNHLQSIDRLNCNSVTLSSAESSVELSANLSWHRPNEFRLQAYPGATRMLGDALDAGSNAEAFWLLTKIPGEPHTFFFARHDQFEAQPGPRRILPVSPLWIREALGAIEFDPSVQHAGQELPNGKIEIRTAIPTSRGPYERTVIVEPRRAIVQQLFLKDAEQKMVASALMSEHQYYSAIDACLPHRVDLHLQANEGPVLAFTLRIGFYTINEATGDEGLRYVMPSSNGLTVVDLVQANATLGQNSMPTSTGPTARIPQNYGSFR